MYKAADGVLFANVKDAVAHENAAFFQVGLTPLMRRLIDAAPGDHPVDLDGQAERLVAKLASDESLLVEFRKFFAKTPTTPSVPVARKRVRKPKAKVAAPVVVSSDPTEAQLAALESLAGTPIVLPTADDMPPPPPPVLAAV